MPADRRTDIGAGDIPPERRGVDFFPYKPAHLAASTPRPSLIDDGLIISGIEHTVGIVSPRRISRAGGAIAWASVADRRPEHSWFEDRGPPRTLLAFITVADHMVLVGSAVAAMHVAEGAGAPLIERVRFAADSPLEGAGFEPSVPRQKDDAFRDSEREVDIMKAQLALLSTRRTGHRCGVPRVVRSVTRSLLLAQQDDLLASPRSLAEPEIDSNAAAMASPLREQGLAAG